MAENTLRPGTWHELEERLFAGAWNQELRRVRASFAFRGMSRVGLDLRPGLARLGGDFAGKERHLIRNFRKYARRSFVGDDSVWNWLALAQHHGLPTRLLDWSYSPYVALHFATADLESMDRDGEVLVLDSQEVNRLLPVRLRQLLETEGSFVFTGELLSLAAHNLENLEQLAGEPFLIFLEPPSLDERIVNQAALFSLMSHADGDVAQWLRAHGDAWRRVVVSADLKWEVRDRLDQVNISERVLFPGLDGLGAWLRRYYHERR